MWNCVIKNILCLFCRWSTVRNTWCVTTATGPWCQTWETFYVTFPSLSSSWSQTPCSWCGSTFWKHFRVCSLCLTQLNKLTVPAKTCQTTSEHLHTNCTFTANLSTQPNWHNRDRKGSFYDLLAQGKERPWLTSNSSVVIYHISSICNWCLIWVSQMLIILFWYPFVLKKCSLTAD